jgi:hypothetical protein
MCALLIGMIIIIVVSGMMVFGVIITVKYFNEEDTVLSVSSSLKYFTVMITPNTIIPLTTMIIIIPIRSAHIGFEEDGIDDDTSVRNMAYESQSGSYLRIIMLVNSRM